MTQLDIAVDAKNRLGECPRWHVPTQSLYWLDIPSQVLHRYFPNENRHITTPLAELVSAFAFRRRGGLVFASRNRILCADVNAQVERLLAQVDLPADARFNDGTVDPAGRFWTGTLNAARRPDNGLYCLASDGSSLCLMDSGIGASNGLAWSADARTMYFVDSPLKLIYAYDFDVDSGTITNRRVFVHTPNQPGVPDGIAADRDGGLWCAYWDGGRVVRYSQAGRVLEVVSVPIPRPTACAFGGEKLDLLYITSARDGAEATNSSQSGPAGAVFVIKTDTQGIQVNVTDF